MNAFSRTTKSLLAIMTLATGVAGMTGCSANAPERMGSTTSKLHAPQAVFKGPATAETKAALGISEWRIYRGKTEYIVTGYDDEGKAVKGVGLSFEGATRSSKAQLNARVLDGSRFSARHQYGGATTSNASLGSLSKSFVSHAVHDMTMLRMGLKTSITRSAVRTGEACSGDMVKIAMTSLQCISNAKASGSTVSKIVKVKRCVAAAESASAAVESCKNAGTTDAADAEKKAADKTADKTAPAKTAPAKTAPAKTAPAKTGDTEKTTTDTNAADAKQDAEQDKEDEAKEAADKKQDAEQDKEDDTKAADAKQDAEQDAADTKADESAGADATTASEDTTCTSCTGTDASDVKADEDTGAVSKAEEPEATTPEPSEPEAPAADPEPAAESETTEA
jgi:hypothetical protein